VREYLARGEEQDGVDALAAPSVATYLEEEIPDGVMTSAADLKISRI
jgi:hypothetical protein